MQLRRKILVVDDNPVNQKILKKLLSEQYDVLLAENGAAALEVLAEYDKLIAGIMLDLVMPVMDGFEFLNRIAAKEEYSNIPVIVTTGNSDKANEKKALQMGAWDFVSKPYDADIIKFRLKNAIARSQLSAFEQLKYLTEFDVLTAIFNKHKLFAETKKMLQLNKQAKFVFIRLDIDRFALINSFYGRDTGDRLLIHIAKCLHNFANSQKYITYGRVEADIFAFCCSYTEESEIYEFVDSLKEAIKSYNISFDIVPVYGIYKIEDCNIPIDVMFDSANLAAKKVKGKYMKTYEVFDIGMQQEVEREQEIVNEMNDALKKEQFHVYLQPKYSLQTNKPAGAEALVRWIHPTKGMISPGAFIPVFERNGFIEKLDYYMWEKVCQLLRSWIDRGITPQPISVNLSRVNLYNSKLVDNICELTAKYNISNKLLNLELLESLYTENPKIMQETIERLHEKGFVVMMDDFGSGYSSLNILKDMDVDVIKIDMGFFTESKIKGRGESIITSVVRMAKWLDIPTIAEGVERIEQVEFLRSIGCEYVQGYYFARPMPVVECEELIKRDEKFAYKSKNMTKVDELWNMVPQVERVFDNVMQAVAIYEIEDDNIDCIRVNNAFYDLFAEDAIKMFSRSPLEVVYEEFRETVKNAFLMTVNSKDKGDCEYLRYCGKRKDLWIHLKLKYICKVGTRNVVIGSFYDITPQKEIDFELHKYKAAMQISKTGPSTLLIVDDMEINRSILENIFMNDYKILQAENGKEALEILKEKKAEIDLILLDLMMPVMDGIKFLEYKRGDIEISNIPVIIITADDTPEQQVKTLSLGANDYITKPFIKEIVMKRVQNVLDSQRRFRNATRESGHFAIQTDDLTGIYNYSSATTIINNILAENEHLKHTLVLFDIDGLKKINTLFGTKCGDFLLGYLVKVLRVSFRTTDVVARLEEDEFCVFMTDTPILNVVLRKCEEVMQKFQSSQVSEEDKVKLPVSIGVAVAENENNFAQLYAKAKAALKNAKSKGCNSMSLYSLSDEN